jgi:hypothetical protein
MALRGGAGQRIHRRETTRSFCATPGDPFGVFRLSIFVIFNHFHSSEGPEITCRRIRSGLMTYTPYDVT